MTNRYDIRKHIGCGGDLTFEKEVVTFVLLNHKRFGVARNYNTEEQLYKAIQGKFGGKAKVKSVKKNLYRCNKCKDLVNVITCPSWERFVLWGKIRVSKQEYLTIKKNRKAGALRY